MRTLFVTSIYSNLWNTPFGGRSGRFDHYIESLCSLSKMGATFIIYTAEEEIEKVSERLCNHFNSQSTFMIRPFDLHTHELHTQIRSLQNGHNTQWPDRCIELQYSKLLWLNDAVEEFGDQYTHYYWIDAGLSHQGLFPSDYACGVDTYTNNWHFSLFNPQILYNINERADSGRIFTIASSPPDNPPIDTKYYTEESQERRNKFHIVGGWFGGRPGTAPWLHNQFVNLSREAIRNGDLYSEEQILTAIAVHHPEKFDRYEFQTWYHKGNIASLAPHLDPSTRSFCNVIEDLQIR